MRCHRCNGSIVPMSDGDPRCLSCGRAPLVVAPPSVESVIEVTPAAASRNHNREGQPWTKREDRLLLRMVQERRSAEEIARRLHRPRHGIYQRLYKMRRDSRYPGLVPRRKSRAVKEEVVRIYRTFWYADEDVLIERMGPGDLRQVAARTGRTYQAVCARAHALGVQTRVADGLLSARSLARMLGVDHRRVLRAIDAGLIPSVRVAGFHRIDPAVVERAQELIGRPRTPGRRKA